MATKKIIYFSFGRGILQSWLLLFAVLSLLIATFFTFSVPGAPDFYSYYVLALLFLIVVCSLPSFSAELKKKSLLADKDEFIHGAKFFLFALALAFYKLDRLDIWLDEELQVNAARALRVNIVQGAAFTQMPLNYFFTALGLKIFGLNEWGARVFSCLFFAGAAVLFGAFVRKVTANKILRAFFPFVFILNPFVIRYAQEGRPYTCLLFCVLLWMHSCWDYFSKSQVGREAFCSLLAASLLLLLSIAFQPLIFLLSVSILAFLALAKFKNRIQIWAFLGCNMLSVFIVLPLIYLSRKNSAVFLKNSMEQIHAGSFFDNAKSTMVNLWPIFHFQLFICVFILALALVIFPFNGKLFLKKKRVAFLGLSLLICIIFLLVFIPIFTLFIQYEIYPRYFLIILPIVLAGIVAALSFLNVQLRMKAKELTGYFLAVSIFVGFIVPEMAHLSWAYEAYAFYRSNSQSKEILHYLESNGADGDRAYLINIQAPGEWEQVGFLGKQFYYSNRNLVQLIGFTEIPEAKSVTDLMLPGLIGGLPKNIFLVFPFPGKPFEMSEGLRSLIERYQGVIGRSYFLVKVPVQESAPLALDLFFNGLDLNFKEKINLFRIYDIQMSLAEREKNPQNCFSKLRKLELLKSGETKVIEIVNRHRLSCGRQ